MVPCRVSFFLTGPLANTPLCWRLILVSYSQCAMGESVVNVELSSALQFSKPFLLSSSKKEYEAVQWLFQEGVIRKMSLSLSHVMSFPSSKLFKHL